MEEDDNLDARRYRRLRVLGVAPDGSKHLEEGRVMRFTNLDEYTDRDLRFMPSRGEFQPKSGVNAKTESY